MSQQVKFGGVSQYFNPDGSMAERGTKTCGHCQRPVEVESERKLLDEMDICRGCMRLICLNCYEIYRQRGCVPAIKRIEAAEERAYRDQQFAKQMGFMR